MLFELRNRNKGQSFQCFMADMLEVLDYYFAYMEDMLMGKRPRRSRCIT